MEITTKSLLTKAQIICLVAHEDASDKNGEPYWKHPFAVAEKVESEEAKQVAYLHDVVEDTNITLQDLLDAGFSQEVVDAVDAVTHREGEEYEDFVLRAKQNPLGRIVKLADLRHNTDPARCLNGPREKYLNAIKLLEE